MVIELYDTTLRDGTQGEHINLSVQDKLLIAERLDEFGVDFIEGGWPSSNPKDEEFFLKAKKLDLKHARLTAFGSTARSLENIAGDPNLVGLVRCEAPVLTIFGKTWKAHSVKSLGISDDENAELIRRSVSFLVESGREVFFDAEHFFDGWKDNAEFAERMIASAVEGGASRVVLCDTNGGTLPHEIAKIVTRVREIVKVPVGIHAHNDGDLAVANSIEAVRAGATQVQGTINGIGERCGNANLASIIPILRLKLGIDCGIDEEHLRQLGSLSRFVNEMANRMPWQHQPFVGLNAFAHKGGIHASAVRKDSRLYEHVDPDLVGNERLILVSDQAGKSTVQLKMKEMGLDLDLDANDPAVRKAIHRVKELEHRGFAYEGAEASFQLLLLQAMDQFHPYFELESFRVIDEKQGHEQEPVSVVTVSLRVGQQQTTTSGRGNGPVNAMDNALREALLPFYPGLANMRLTDFKVRVLTTQQATRATVRVLIESTDGIAKWGTVGVSANMVDASYQALADAIQYKLMLDKTRPPG